MSDPFKKMLNEINEKALKKFKQEADEMTRLQKELYESYMKQGFKEKQALYLVAEMFKPSGDK